MGLPVDDKEKVLASLVEVLQSTGTPYAVIGGVAMQLYTEEPRTTADLDIALRSHDDLPREKLEAAGFSFQLATMPDLILLKLEAAEEPKWRMSKKIHDVGDVVRLLEDHPELDSPEIRARLGRIRSAF